MVSGVLTKQKDHPDSRKSKENKACDFQPKLAQGNAEMRQHRLCAVHYRAEGPRLPDLLAEYPGSNAQFSGGRGAHHSLSILPTCGFRIRKEYGEDARFSGSASKLTTGGFVDQQLKQLMKELGEAINESLADSEQIADVVTRIKDGGYDIFLVLEATIGVSRPGEKTSDKTSMVTTLASNPDLKVSEQDLKFLKSLRIKIEDDAA